MRRPIASSAVAPHSQVRESPDVILAQLAAPSSRGRVKRRDRAIVRDQEVPLLRGKPWLRPTRHAHETAFGCVECFVVAIVAPVQRAGVVAMVGALGAAHYRRVKVCREVHGLHLIALARLPALAAVLPVEHHAPRHLGHRSPPPEPFVLQAAVLFAFLGGHLGILLLVHPPLKLAQITPASVPSVASPSSCTFT